MLFQTVRSAGLAHLSYVAGDGGRLAVIDPRRDVDIYVHIAQKQGMRITHIFETHCHEDFISGSRELSRHTGASIYHGAGLPFKFGNDVSDGDTFELGKLLFTVLATPGHTAESISLAMADVNFARRPVAVFTGDTLFVGDVGRTDLVPERRAEAAADLYDSVFGTLLPLGDEVLIYPAHGGGSSCGARIAAREFSTLGLERMHNPVLRDRNREDFVRRRMEQSIPVPPYFERMGKINREGPLLLGELPRPATQTPEQFAEAMAEGMIAVDVRSPEAFGGAHVPGSVALPMEMLPAYAGWFLPYDRSLGLVLESPDQAETAVRCLIRVGFENIAATLGGGIREWQTRGYRFRSLPEVHIGELSDRLDSREEFTVLDVRTPEEFQAGHLPRAVNIHVGELSHRLAEVPRDRPVVTLCSTGQRATIAASLLLRHGFETVQNCLGAMEACESLGCPTIVAEQGEPTEAAAI